MKSKGVLFDLLGFWLGEGKEQGRFPFRVEFAQESLGYDGIRYEWINELYFEPHVGYKDKYRMHVPYSTMDDRLKLRGVGATLKGMWKIDFKRNVGLAMVLDHSYAVGEGEVVIVTSIERLWRLKDMDVPSVMRYRVIEDKICREWEEQGKIKDYQDREGCGIL